MMEDLKKACGNGENGDTDDGVLRMPLAFLTQTEREEGHDDNGVLEDLQYCPPETRCAPETPAVAAPRRGWRAWPPPASPPSRPTLRVPAVPAGRSAGSRLQRTTRWSCRPWPPSWEAGRASQRATAAVSSPPKASPMEQATVVGMVPVRKSPDCARKRKCDGGLGRRRPCWNPCPP